MLVPTLRVHKLRLNFQDLKHDVDIMVCMAIFTKITVSRASEKLSLHYREQISEKH